MQPGALGALRRMAVTGPASHPGVPPGVVNVVFGTGPRVGEALVSHPDVPLISFTGSQPTAERITQLSAPHCKKLSLELGGKNPAIVFEDSNVYECIPTTVRSSFANQVCPLSPPPLCFLLVFNSAALPNCICGITVTTRVSRSMQGSFSERRMVALHYSFDCLINLNVTGRHCGITAPV